MFDENGAEVTLANSTLDKNSKELVMAGRSLTFTNALESNAVMTAGRYTAFVRVDTGEGVIEASIPVEVVTNGNANLSALNPSVGALDPTFNASKTEYTVKLPSTTSATSASVTASAAATTSTVTIKNASNIRDEENRTATVTVKAKDGTEKVYTVEFIVNNKPELRDGIADVEVVAADLDGDIVTIDLVRAFRDKDGDELTFACNKDSDANSVVKTTLIEGNKLKVRIDKTKTGTVNYTVTATDEAGETVSTTFKLEVK